MRDKANAKGDRAGRPALGLWALGQAQVDPHCGPLEL